MNFAADMGRHSGQATPSLHDDPYRQFNEATGRRSTYPLPIPVQTIRTTSGFGDIRLSEYASIETVVRLAAFMAEHGALSAAVLAHFGGDID